MHNRSDVVDFSVVEAMRVLNCHFNTFSLLSINGKVEASLKK